MSDQQEKHRWSDDKLETFYQEFMAHMAKEAAEVKQQAEIHTALFQLEDRARNTPAGVVQMLARLDERLQAMEITSDRQKRFIGGFLFAFSCVGFLFTDTWHKIVSVLKG